MRTEPTNEATEGFIDNDGGGYWTRRFLEFFKNYLEHKKKNILSIVTARRRKPQAHAATVPDHAQNVSALGVCSRTVSPPDQLKVDVFHTVDN